MPSADVLVAKATLRKQLGRGQGSDKLLEEGCAVSPAPQLAGLAELGVRRSLLVLAVSALLVDHCTADGLVVGGVELQGSCALEQGQPVLFLVAAALHDIRTIKQLINVFVIVYNI